MVTPLTARTLTRWFGVLSVATLLAAAGCESSNDTTQAAGGAGGNASGSAQGSNDTSNGGGNSGGAGGFNLGVGSGGGTTDDGCKGVDFLFVIDNSVSMLDQQTALIASFPQFMQTIDDTLDTDDWHIMVADTDSVTRCTEENCMTGAQSASTLCLSNPGTNNGYACNGMFEACDSVMGAGVIHPAGDGASNQLCNVAGGNRYIIKDDPNLTDTFSCMAQVGLAGHPSERPMDAIVAAMAPDINGTDGCNAGFLRDDAILVITFISDDPNYEDAGVAQDWYDAVVAAKGGNAESVVVLGLTPAFDGCGPGNKPDKGKHWSDFIKLFGQQGLEGSICSDDYNGFFQSAVSVIDTTCNDFEPPS